MGVVGILGLYLAVTAPFLFILLFVHRIRGEDSGLFYLALVLQIVPIGLLYFPLGLVSLWLLGWALARFARRSRRFRRSGLWRPDLQQRWTSEYLACIVACGLALEQKALSVVFLYASAGRGYALLWEAVLPGSLLLWVAIGAWIRHERRLLAQFVRPDPAGS